MNKINATLSDHDSEMIEENPLEIIPGKLVNKRIRNDDYSPISTNS